MVSDCKLVSRARAFRTGRASTSTRATLRRGHLMGTSYRSALERFTKPLSFSGHLLASIERVDDGRSLGEGVGPTAALPRPNRQSRRRTSDGRRHVFLGKKRGNCVGKTKRGKGTKIMLLVDGQGLPLSVNIHSASPNEVTLIEHLLDRRILRRRIPRLIYDKAADSDPLRDRLAAQGTELICPHRANRAKPPKQDRRKLRRYRRRWTIERSVGWLQNFRRVVTRYEHHAHMFLGFVQLACLMVV